MYTTNICTSITEYIFVIGTVCILQIYIPLLQNTYNILCYRHSVYRLLQMYIPLLQNTYILCYRHSVYSANVCTKLLQNMYLLQTQCVYCKCMYQTVTEHVFVTDTVCILQMYVPNCYRTCICYRHSVYSANVCTKLLQNMYLLQTQCVYCKCMYQTVTEHVFVTDTVCILQMYVPNCYRTCICYRHSVYTVPNCYRTCICYRHSVYTANVCTKLLQNMYLLQTQCV